MVSYWSLRDSKSLQVSWTLLRILADLNYTVVRIVSTRPLISKSSSSSINPLVTVPKAPITIGITVTFRFHSFSVPWQGRGTYFSFCFLSILLCGQPGQQVLFFLLIITRSGRLAKIRLSVCNTKSPRSLRVSFSRTDSGRCIYHLF